MDTSTPAWLNTLTIIGAVLVLAGGSFIGYRISNMRQTYRDLRPSRPAGRESETSGNVVFMIVSVLVLMIGVLLLALGIAGIAAPDQLP